MSDDKCFEEFAKGKDQNMWQYFLRNQTGELAKCKKCSSVLKTSGGSTSGLDKHLRLVHSILSSKRQPTPASEASISKQPQPSTSSVQSFFCKKVSRLEESLPLIVSRMVALDGLPMSILCKSVDIRSGIMARGYKDLPSSRNTIRRMIMEFHNKMVGPLTTEFQRIKVIK